MSTVAIDTSRKIAESAAITRRPRQALAIWIVPLLYPLALAGISGSAALVRAASPGGLPLLFVSIAWSAAGPFVGWWTLNYLDENQFDRAKYRLVVHGALLAAITPPLYTGLRQISGAIVPAWYTVTALLALATFLPLPSSASTFRFRRIHALSAVLIILFAVAHVVNHSFAIISLRAHTAVLHVLRLVYRQRLVESILVTAVLGQVCTGSVMVWRYYLRAGTRIRNLQIVSGLFLAVFLLSHVAAAYHGRHRGIDTDFIWATSGAAGLLGVNGSAAQVPRYPLSVLMIFTHLACLARFSLPRFTSDTVARKAFYGVLTLGSIATVIIGAAACGVHLIQ